MSPKHSRRAAFGALVASALLAAGCVSTSVTSRALQKTSAPIEQMLVIVQPGKFAAGNVASSLGQKNVDALVPSLAERVPVVFSLNGVATRAAKAGAPSAVATPAEHVLVITPTSATYSSKSGQELFVRAELRDPAKSAVLWQADIRLATLGFGKFDNKVADDLSLQMLEKLRSDGIAKVSAGPLRTQ